MLTLPVVAALTASLGWASAIVISQSPSREDAWRAVIDLIPEGFGLTESAVAEHVQTQSTLLAALSDKVPQTLVMNEGASRGRSKEVQQLDALLGKLLSVADSSEYQRHSVGFCHWRYTVIDLQKH
jgi:hypothetical protein